MIRRAALVVLVLAFNPLIVSAQDTVFTVTAPSADVYKGPTTVAPVIGRADRGTVLAVARNLGSWAKVTWPSAPDGVGYVHLTTGRLAASKADAPAANAAPRTSAAPGPATTISQPAARREPRQRVTVSEQATGAEITHIRRWRRLGSTRSFGGTARMWRDNEMSW